MLHSVIESVIALALRLGDIEKCKAVSLTNSQETKERQGEEDMRAL